MGVLIVFLPLVGFCFTKVFGKYLGSKGSALVTTGCLFLSFLISFFAFYKNYFDYILILFIWKKVSNFDWGFFFNSLAIDMCVVITLFSFIINLNSIKFLNNDPDLARFISNLSLLTFFLLILVTSDTFVRRLIDWEIVYIYIYVFGKLWLI